MHPTPMHHRGSDARPRGTPHEEVRLAAGTDRARRRRRGRRRSRAGERRRSSRRRGAPDRRRGHREHRRLLGRAVLGQAGADERPRAPGTAHRLRRLLARGGDASDALGLLTAPHTARVYVDGATKQRVQVTEQLAERDVIRNGSTVWTWDSEERAATKVTLPSRSAETPGYGTTTPGDVAERAIDAITPTTEVSKPVATSVAGHDAWLLTLTPKSSDTLVGTVQLAVDQQTGLPLRASVTAAGKDDPAFQVGFTSLSYGAPAARLFAFTPPSGADVTTKDLSDADPGTHGNGSGHGVADHGATVTGSGWDTVVALPAGTADSTGLGSEASGLLDQLTTAVDGGRALQTSLVSVYLADDGRVLAGAVPVATLVAAAK
ncbi:hypothetical protein [Curtobacterium sp. MCJR17_043]|uniref:LolA family protein n=1 Tax=Curtobacterium sp. MCJR17_043 TaxID=2175660 RepID=UPI0024DF8EDB|nr:hypothetical protein [Curtobacterium sp. MCJR17_043]WIB35472.1 hypothetical protein DEJ15_14735 [Curtobacterium sp. MCJR17_043]